MHLIMTTVLAVAIAAPSSTTPRVVVSVAKSSVGNVALRIENASSQEMRLSATTYVALLKLDAPDQHVPLYWAKVEDPGVPTTARPLKLAGRKTSTVHLDPRSLSWSQDRSGLVPEQPIGRVVPPGDYELQLQIVDGRDHWWRSRELPVTVSANGILRF
jgi:hypothetical protein